MKRKIQFTKRLIVPLLVILAVFVATLTVGVTLARYIRGAANSNNEFGSLGSINPQVVNGELNADGEMKNVYIQVGTTGYPVYVRVKVLITWQKDGDVLYVNPVVGTDYEIEYNNTDWKAIKSYDADEEFPNTYYYFIGTGTANNSEYLNGVVKSGGNTSELIKSFSTAENLKPPYDGYTLNVEVIVETVQAVGKTDEDNGEIPAWWDAWGFTSDPFNSNGNSGTGSGGTSEGSQS